MVSSILSVLANDKLTWENYVKWKSNMNAILVSEDLDFVMTDEYPPRTTKMLTKPFGKHTRIGLRPIKGPAGVY